MPHRAVTPPRPFGRAEDLEIEFAAGDRPGLVTAVLAGCCGAGARHWWAQPVGARVHALLGVLALTEARDELTATACCDAAGCGERMEMRLPFAALTALSDAAEGGDSFEVALDGARTATLRRPNGNDLRRWRALPAAAREEAVSAMLRTLVVAGETGAADEAAIGAALAARDPLVDFNVSCVCPACGHVCEPTLDLEGLALTRLAARQQALLREVHALASRYGWTESEVLAISPPRRARYLGLIEAAA